MMYKTNITISTCTALSTLYSNYTPSDKGLLPLMLFELIITMIVIFIIIALLYFLPEWWYKRGVKEITPQLPQYPTGGGGGDDPWTKFVKKVKRLFARR